MLIQLPFCSSFGGQDTNLALIWHTCWIRLSICPNWPKWNSQNDNNFTDSHSSVLRDKFLPFFHLICSLMDVWTFGLFNRGRTVFELEVKKGIFSTSSNIWWVVYIMCGNVRSLHLLCIWVWFPVELPVVKKKNGNILCFFLSCCCSTVVLFTCYITWMWFISQFNMSFSLCVKIGSILTASVMFMFKQ